MSHYSNNDRFANAQMKHLRHAKKTVYVYDLPKFVSIFEAQEDDLCARFLGSTDDHRSTDVF